MNDIVIYPSKGKMATLALGSLAMAAMCGAEVVFHKEMEVPDWAAGVGVLGALIMFACFFWALVRLFNPSPSVLVNRDGVTDNSSATSVGLIRWDEIRQVTVFRMNHVKNLGIIVADPEAVFRRQSSTKGSLLRASFKLTQVPISIPQSTLPVSADDLANQIIAYRQAMPVASAVAPPPPALRCAMCGADLKTITKFCPDCGAKVQGI
jgi:hypothetical protein